MSTPEAVAGPSDQAERMVFARAERERRKAQPRPPAPPKVKPVPKAPKPKPEPVPYKGSENPDVDEQSDVHEVYERIAPHFSQTRHKPWPLISTFLHSLPPNSIGLDSGGGNGKYVPTAREAGVGLVVMDRSLGLLGVARTQAGFGGDQKGKSKAMGDAIEQGGGDVVAVGECVRGDLTGEGWRRGVFDFAISIAAIHHLSTPARRRRSVQALLQPLVHAPKPPYARFMIYVWAYEQSSGSKRRMGATASAPPSDLEIAELGEKVQDVLVPWVLQAPKPKAAQSAPSEGAGDERPANGDKKGEPESQVLHRYYHLFVKGELRELVISAAEEEGYAVLPGGVVESVGLTGGEAVKDGQKWLRIQAEGWEADNWWIEGEVGSGPPILG